MMLLIIAVGIGLFWFRGSSGTSAFARTMTGDGDPQWFTYNSSRYGCKAVSETKVRCELHD
jgi:hypothetical protein